MRYSRTDGEHVWELCADALPGAEVRRGQNLFIYYHNPTGNEEERFGLEYVVVADTFTPAPTPSTTPSPVGGDNGTSVLRLYTSYCLELLS